MPIRIKSELVKYLAVGGVGAVVDLGIFYYINKCDVMEVELAKTISYECGIVNNFLWNYYWTFRGSRKPILRAGLLFHAAAILGMVTNMALTSFLFRFCSIEASYAAAFATMVVCGMNYVLASRFVFRKPL